jgi:hypothetical protein
MTDEPEETTESATRTATRTKPGEKKERHLFAYLTDQEYATFRGILAMNQLTIVSWLDRQIRNIINET